MQLNDRGNRRLSDRFYRLIPIIALGFVIILLINYYKSAAEFKFKNIPIVKEENKIAINASVSARKEIAALLIEEQLSDPYAEEIFDPLRFLAESK